MIVECLKWTVEMRCNPNRVSPQEQRGAGERGAGFEGTWTGPVSGGLRGHTESVSDRLYTSGPSLCRLARRRPAADPV